VLAECCGSRALPGEEIYAASFRWLKPPATIAALRAKTKNEHRASPEDHALEVLQSASAIPRTDFSRPDCCVCALSSLLLVDSTDRGF
jgi:hypothetical protein